MPTANQYGIMRRQLLRIGDANPANYDGGIVFRVSGNTGSAKPYVLVEYVQWNGDEDDATGALYQVPLPDDVAKWCDWANVADIIDSAYACTDLTADEWRRLACGSVAERVRCLEDVAGYYGWDNLDNYPLTVTRPDVRVRYARCA